MFKVIISVGYYHGNEMWVSADQLVRYVELLEQAFPGNWTIASPPEGSAGEPDGEPDSESAEELDFTDELGFVNPADE